MLKWTGKASLPTLLCTAYAACIVSVLGGCVAVENSSSSAGAVSSATSGVSSSLVVTSVSSIAVVASSASSNDFDNAIVPRISCPAGPTRLQANGGDWAPHHAVSNYPAAEYDTVVMFKDLLKLQDPIRNNNLVMQWSLHTPFQSAQNPSAKYPLVIYLHGGAEARIDGDGPSFLDNRHAKSFFASSNSLLTAAHQEQFPAFIAAPFCDGKAPEGTKCAFGAAEWASNGYGAINAQLDGQGSPYGSALVKMIEILIANKPIDPARIYVLGASMGGGGTWDLAARRPDLIAAAVPFAGHPLADNALRILADFKVPVWSHHGAKDNTNSYGAAKSAIASLASKGGCAWQTTYNPSSNLQNDDPGDSDPSDATHNIWARAYNNPDLWPWVFAQAQPRANDQPQVASSQSSHAVSSAVFSGNKVVLESNNNYNAPKADLAPVIDGNMDAVWGQANWMKMSVAWTGFESLKVPSSAADFTGRYKAIWDVDFVYLLFEITDDVINTSGQYYQHDTIELFVDEDKSGGPHESNHSAFAYHISHNKEVVDSGGSIDGHITVAIKPQGNVHTWEIKMEVYANHNGYNPSEQAAARVKLAAGKVMGFSPSYIDNDGNGSREHFMSSVKTAGHQNNQGYINADSFGSLTLLE